MNGERSRQGKGEKFFAPAAQTGLCPEKDMPNDFFEFIGFATLSGIETCLTLMHKMKMVGLDR
ncbi:hypothetical protein [Desulfosarcina widdelii]|uniref:hypothetical protein n=1 Tax=Desulfosarcina widdelii TaxID=947919 RepID=UPI0012D34942|nr:hypothetical protein [Desulfosarcina widdelii]